ncbi:MAG: hypothetical protein WCD52_04280 [Xanthobacteraceae bacterium]
MEQLAYSLSELAAAARVGESTLRKSIAAGAGPRTVAFGRRRIVLAGDARDWLAALREKVESATA